jgi:hypothetical protein
MTRMIGLDGGAAADGGLRPTRRLAAPLPWLMAALVLTLVLPGPAARAATYCVTTSAELQTALTAAAASPADDEVRVRQGIYVTFNATFTYTSQNPGWFFITGGWVEANGNNCGAQVRNAASTVLTGSGQRQVLQINYLAASPPASGPRIGVDNLSIRDGLGVDFVRGGGLAIVSTVDAYTELWVDNVIVAGSSGYFGGGANLYVARGLIRVVNSLFTGNNAPTSAFGHLAAVVVATDIPAGDGIVIANSTFGRGTCAGQGGRGCGIGLNVPAGVRATIVNSLFTDNAISDVNVEGGGGSLGIGTASAGYSLIPAVTGNAPLTQSNALSGDPRFVDAANQDYRLRDDSPFINAGLGTLPVYGFQPSDIAGNLRLRFGALDPGAYENQTWDFLFANGFQ